MASLGTCGTVTGCGSYLKEKNKDIQVIGAHPPKKHDIPGVRSIAQLRVTAHFKPDSYDQLVEVTNEHAFELCRQLNQDESIPAGPSSGMQVAAAMKAVPDEPGVVAVLIFCDQVFKYASSIVKHCPTVFPPKPQLEPAEVSCLAQICKFAQQMPGNTVRADELKALAADPAVKVIDVRPAEEWAGRKRVRDSLNIPLKQIMGEEVPGCRRKVRKVTNAAGAVQKLDSSSTELLPEPIKGMLNDHVKGAKEVLMVCNRGKDSLLSLLALRVALGEGAPRVRHVGEGMFEWMSIGGPVDGPDVLPPAMDVEEEAWLERLGYNPEGLKKVVA